LDGVVERLVGERGTEAVQAVLADRNQPEHALRPNVGIPTVDPIGAMHDRSPVAFGRERRRHFAEHEAANRRSDPVSADHHIERSTRTVAEPRHDTTVVLLLEHLHRRSHANDQWVATATEQRVMQVTA
jgi:hypothetical protein